MSKIRRIEITFPIEVNLPEDDWQKRLMNLMTEICNKYEKDNPDRVMWVFSVGDKILWNEPHEPTYDSSIFTMEISEKEK